MTPSPTSASGKRYVLSTFLFPAGDDNYPKLFPDADSGSVLDAFLHQLMVFIHSYTEALHIQLLLFTCVVRSKADSINSRRRPPLAQNGSTCLRPISLPSLSVTCSFLR